MSDAAVVKVIGNWVWWRCPGCGQDHGVPVDGPKAWGWNGDTSRPTLQPSVKNTKPGTDYVCHCYVRDGQIQFLNDCTHELAGQTVPVPELPEWMR